MELIPINSKPIGNIIILVFLSLTKFTDRKYVIINHMTGKERLASIPNIGIAVNMSKFLKFISFTIGDSTVVFSSSFCSCSRKPVSGSSSFCS